MCCWFKWKDVKESMNRGGSKKHSGGRQDFKLTACSPKNIKFFKMAVL